MPYICTMLSCELEKQALRDELNRLWDELEACHETGAKNTSHIVKVISERNALKAALVHIHDKLHWDDDRERWYLDSTFTISTVEMLLR